VRTDVISPGGEPVETKTYKDVIVDKVFMEQHTTGVDPFTGRDYGASEFPKEHRYDPVTGLPIFHRYIAGTKERIYWPDEKKEVKERGAPETQQKEVKRSLWDKIRGKNKQVSTSKPTTKPRREAKGLSMAEKTEKRELKTEMHELRKSLKPVRPKSQKVDEYDVYDADTTRNVIDATETMTYNIVQPPFPETLGEELRTHMKDFAAAQRKDQDVVAPTKKPVKFMTEAAVAASEQGEAKRVAALKMKTPMQLRWESEQAQKIKQREESPLVSTDELMAALGQHIEQQKTLKALKKTVQKQSLRTEELD
jgi:large subunit ribosomal protein L24